MNFAYGLKHQSDESFHTDHNEIDFQPCLPWSVSETETHRSLTDSLVYLKFVTEFFLAFMHVDMLIGQNEMKF